MKSSKSALIATIIVFLLAVIAAVVAFLMLRSDDDFAGSPDGEQHSHLDHERNHSSNFRPSEEFEAEMRDEAERLIKSNYDIIQLFVTRGVPVRPEPYGNAPENGIYYANSEHFQTLDDLYAFVDSVFIPEEAELVKTNTLENGEDYYSNFGQIYFDRDGKLGINAAFADFVPYDEFPVDWTNPTFTIKPIAADEAFLLVQLSIDGTPVAFERTMYKENGVWLLDELILY